VKVHVAEILVGDEVEGLRSAIGGDALCGGMIRHDEYGSKCESKCGEEFTHGLSFSAKRL